MSLQTPKKFCSSESRTCRLCGAIGDNRHSKNIFKKQNENKHEMSPDEFKLFCQDIIKEGEQAENMLIK